MPLLDSILVHSPTSLDVLVSLRKDILTGKLKTGTHLKKMDLATQFDVSRGSVSQALYKLEMEGLIESEGKGRARVLGITEKDVIDMFDIRLILEKRAVEILAAKEYVDYTPLIQVMNSMKKENDRGAGADPVLMAQLGFHVHVTMFQMAGNRAIFQAWKGASGLMQEIVNINGAHVPAEETYRKHRILCDCIIQKWPNSVQVIEEHLMAGSRNVYLEALNNIKHKEG
ncbi:GntR family transcriptional regulator [Spirochaetia bacterium]|nr:GntR family transcriptional regulator [Spirochaetia bacterium]